MDLNNFEKWLKKQNLSKATIMTYTSSVKCFLSEGYELKADSMCRWKEEELKRTKATSVATRIYAINKYAEFMRVKYRLKNCNMVRLGPLLVRLYCITQTMEPLFML